MRIAIPTFGNRVSPRFDCAQSVLIVTVDNGQLGEREEVAASSWAPYERINRLVEFGVDAVVCGGIDCWSAESLESAGIAIYGWVTGEIEDALAAYVQGDLYSENATQGAGRSGRRRILDCEDLLDRNRGSQEEPIQGGGQGRRQRAGRRGGARWGPSGY
jgi:predicted Fe-Mo cluster-binding NifX family protein